MKYQVHNCAYLYIMKIIYSFVITQTAIFLSKVNVTNTKKEKKNVAMHK